MKRWRVSQVESFRQFEQDDEADPQQFAHELMHGFDRSHAMRAGTAFHLALERAQENACMAALEADGHTFAFAADVQVDLPLVRELRASRTYIVDGQPFVVTGQVDAIDGQRIIDHKTTARFDPDRYMAGYQWRLYLDIFGAQSFRWNVFEISELEPYRYEVREMHTLTQHRYPDLHADCQILVERFARFVRDYVNQEATP